MCARRSCREVDWLSKRSKWQQQREGRPMGPNVYPDPSCGRAARVPRSGAEEELQQCCDRCSGPGVWGHVSRERRRRADGSGGVGRVRADGCGGVGRSAAECAQRAATELMDMQWRLERKGELAKGTVQLSEKAERGVRGPPGRSTSSWTATVMTSRAV